MDKIVQYKNNDYYIVFYSKSCIYCKKTFDLLRYKKKYYKGYNVDQYGLRHFTDEFIKNHAILNFDINHKTKPMIFYHGKFIGGYDQLFLHLS